MIQDFLNAAWYWQLGMVVLAVAGVSTTTMMGIMVYESNKEDL